MKSSFLVLSYGMTLSYNYHFQDSYMRELQIPPPGPFVTTRIPGRYVARILVTLSAHKRVVVYRWHSC